MLACSATAKTHQALNKEALLAILTENKGSDWQGETVADLVSYAQDKERDHKTSETDKKIAREYIKGQGHN